MASFREEYQRLFGPVDPYDPIDIGPFADPVPRRSALPTTPEEAIMQDGAKQTAPDPLLSPSLDDFPTRGSGEGVEASDFGRALGAGTVATGEMAVGGLEYIARQNEFLDGAVADFLTKGRQGLTGVREGILEGMTPEAKAQISREFLSLDPNQTIWQGNPLEVASAVSLKFTQALPATVITLLPAGMYFRAAASTKALTYLGASEGGLSLGGIANGIAQEVEGSTSEQLLQGSPRYGQLLQQLGNDAAARKELIREAQGVAPIIGGAMVAAVSMTAGRYLEPVFMGERLAAGVGGEAVRQGLPLASRAARGFGAEALQEGPQSGVEQFVQNYSARLFDADRQLSEGVAEAVAEGSFIGGLTGGGFSAALGARPPRPEPPPAPLPAPVVEESGQQALPGFGPQQLVPEEPEPPEPEITPEMAARSPNVIFTVQQRDLDLREPVRDVVPFTGREEGQVRGPEGGQPTLPLQTRRRGQAPDILTQLPRGYEPPTGLPSTEPEQAVDTDEVTIEPGDRQAIRARMDDLLGRVEEPTTPQAATQADLPTRTIGGHLVRMFDAQGNLIDEDVFESSDEASDRADVLRDDFPDARITVTPMRETEGTPKKARLSTTKQIPEPASTDAPPKRSTEVAADRIRAELPFDDRIEPIDIVSKAPTAERGAERLVSAAVAAKEEEDVRRIGGFYSPDHYEFNSPEREREYREAWGQLVDAELTIEMSGQKRAREAAEKRRTKLFKELGTIRQLDKPKRKPLKSEQMIRAARAASPEVVETTTRAAEDGAFRSVTEQQPADEDVIGDLQPMSEEQLEKVIVRDESGKAVGITRDGEVLFEQAVRYFASRRQKITFPKDRDRIIELAEDRAEEDMEVQAFIRPQDVASNLPQLLEQAKRIYRTPGRKLKFINRQLAALSREGDEDDPGGQKSVKGVGVVKKAVTQKGTGQPRAALVGTKKDKSGKKKDKRGKKAVLKTEPLTQITAVYDESVSAKLARKEKLRKVRTSLKKNVSQAKRYLKKFETAKFQAYLAAQRHPDTKKLSKEGSGYLYGKQYLAQIIQFAESSLQVDHTDKEFISLLEGLDKLLGSLEGLSVEKFASEWSKLARANEFESIAAIPDDAIAALRDPVKREKVTKKSNDDRRNHAARMHQIEEVWGSDAIFNEFIGPVLRKASQAVYDIVNEVGRGVYVPTMEEIAGLKMALSAYRRTGHPKYQTEFYQPIREELEYLGFEFDAKGDMIEEFTPSEAYLGPDYRAKYGEPPSADRGSIAQLPSQGVRGSFKASGASSIIDPDPVVARDTSIRAREGQDVQDQRAAVVGIDKANALIQGFKNKVTSKTLINGIKRAERQMIRGLRKVGAWTDVSPGLGRISIGGYASRTYRLVGPRLDARKMTRREAKEFVDRIATFPMPRELGPVAKRMHSEEAATEAQDRGERTFSQNVKRFIAENDLELFLEATEPVANDASYIEAAQAVGDHLASGSVDASIALTELLKNTPVGSFYYNLAEKLSKLDLSGIDIAYASASEFPGGELGKFKPGQNRIILNKDALLESMLDGEQAFGARVMHTLTHEILHGATHNAIRNDSRVRDYFTALRNAAREEWLRRNSGRPASAMPYGLRESVGEKVVPIDEFVVEAYSNPEFQNFLRSIRTDSASLWDRILAFVRSMLGVNTRELPDNLLEAVMLAEDVLFEDAGVAAGRPTGDFSLENYDEPLRNVANQVWSRVTQGGNMWQRVRNALAEKSRYVMTMDQLAKTYQRFFTDGSMARYVDAFKRRNAMNSELMRLPQKLSREWTELEETSPEEALEVSHIATEATLNDVAVAASIDDEANAHVTSDERIAKHNELHDRFNKMSEKAQTLYKRVSKYYRTAIKAESLLLMQNALRGVLTHGAGARLSQEEFTAKFDAEKMKSLTNREAIRDELKDFVDENQLDDVVETITKMSSLPEQQKGDYFPLMRYGDYVVFAEKKHEPQIFEERKEAWAERRRLLDGDPTLDISVYAAKEGGFILRVIEREFVMAESITEAEKHRERLIGIYGKDNVFDVNKKFNRKMEEAAISSNAGLNAVLKTLEGNPAAQAAIKSHYLRTLSDQSFRKHETKRKKRRGVDRDIQHRNFVNYAKQSAYYTAQLKFGWRMGEALQDMQEFTKKRKQHEVDPQFRHMTTEQLNDVVNQIDLRDKMTHDPFELNKLIRKGVELTQFMMLTSPSYHMINLTQPWMVTAPVLGARHGIGSAVSAMKNAQMLIKTPMSQESLASWGGLKAIGSRQASDRAFDVIEQLYTHLRSRTENGQDYIDLIDELRKQNIMDVSVLTELREIAQGIEGGAWARVLDASRIMSHITEVNNRVVAAIAAFDLEMSKQVAAGLSREEAIKVATEYAGDIVSETQFNYSTNNKPPLFQPGGPLKWAAPLMFQFMQWPQHMYALLIRNYAGAVGKGVIPKAEARKALIGLLSTHAAVGGMVGMMLQPIKWAFGMVMFAFGDDDEPYTFANAINGRTYDRMVTDGLTTLFGNDIGLALSRGLPAGVLGTDLSSRMSMGTLYFVDLRGENAESILGSMVASFGGATLNQVMNWGNAAASMIEGDVFRGIEQASPKVARDAMRAVRYYNEGLVNNAGDTVIRAEDLSFGDLFAQSIGLQPVQISNFFEAQSAIKSAETHARDRKDDLVKRFRTADTSERREILRDAAEFNRDNPAFRIRRSTLLRGVQSKREREVRFRRFGANVDEQSAAQFSQYGEPYKE